MSFKIFAALIALAVSAAAAPSRLANCGQGRTTANAAVSVFLCIVFNLLLNSQSPVLCLVRRFGRHPRELVSIADDP